MLSYPKVGDRAQVWYRKQLASHMPWHGRVGEIAIVCKGPGPRNHGIRIDGQIIGVPRGNLRKAPHA